MTERYEPRKGVELGWISPWVVLDTETRFPVFGCSTWCSAIVRAGKLNRENGLKKAPKLAAPECPDCARYKRALDEYRHELAQISRTTRDTETADTALAAIERVMAMVKGE